MNKSDVINRVSQKLGTSYSEAEMLVNLTLNTIKEGIEESGRVTLTGFGSFDLRSRKAREGRNPQTGQSMDIPASRTIGFKPGKAWKEMLQQQALQSADIA